MESPTPPPAVSLELGMIRCIDEAKEQVRRETGLSVTDARWNVYWQDKATAWTRMPGVSFKTGADLHRSPAVRSHGSRLRFKSGSGSDAGRRSSVTQRGIRPQDGLRRVFTLLDDKVNAEGFERILGQFSGGVSKK